MAEDFDLTGLATYLHLDLVQVRRMAERGKIPGRRIGGDWRFNPAEIHHWLEERIALADQEERGRIEEALEKRRDPASDVVSVEALLHVPAIETPLPARTKTSVVDEMVQLGVRTGLLWDPDKMAEAVRQREELYPTAIEGGVALLHPRRPMSSILGGPFLALGRTPRGIPFGDPNGGLTDLFFLICSMDDGGHLRTLARLSRLLGTPGLLDELREAPDAIGMREVLIECEQTLPE